MKKVAILKEDKAAQQICPYLKTPAIIVDDIRDIPEDSYFLASDDYYTEEVFHAVRYEDIAQKLVKYAVERYYLDYNHNFLKHLLKEADDPAIHTVVAGSSYARWGIETAHITTDTLGKAVNVSQDSQDLYYVNLILREFCQKNDNIKNLVIGCSYYYFFSDMSRAENPDEMLRIEMIYEPIFGDQHNRMFMPRQFYPLATSDVLDIKKFVDEKADQIWKENRGDYFVKDIMDRKVMKNCDWPGLESSEKIRLGKERAELHNKSLKRKYTFEENKKILQEITDFCKKRGIRLIFAVIPPSAYYKTFFNREFQTAFYDTLNEIEGDIHLLDMFDWDVFAEEDFADADHLSESGAEKASIKLKELLESFENG